MNEILHEMELLEMELVGLDIEYKKAVYERDKAWQRLYSLKHYYKSNELGDIGYVRELKYRSDIAVCKKQVEELRRRRNVVRERLKLLNIRYNEEVFGVFYKSEIDDLCYFTFW